MKKFVFILVCAFLASFANARLSTFGFPAEFGLEDDPNHYTDINSHTWDTFTSFEWDKIANENLTSLTLFTVEYYSTGVMDGIKVGDSTMVASFVDRRNFFGGEGYTDLNYYAPVNSQYAQQATFYGGWKYNITNFLHLDIGGNIVYSTKPVIGPGLAGLGGESWRGDIYVGFIADKVYLNPFFYVSYDPTLDSKKIQTGISPVVDLSELTAIKNLKLQSQIMYGYVNASRWGGDTTFNGSYFHSEYSYIQAETKLQYTINSITTFIGVGWAWNNLDNLPSGLSSYCDNMLWFSCGVGYVF